MQNKKILYMVIAIILLATVLVFFWYIKGMNKKDAMEPETSQEVMMESTDEVPIEEQIRQVEEMLEKSSTPAPASEDDGKTIEEQIEEVEEMLEDQSTTTSSEQDGKTVEEQIRDVEEMLNQDK